MRKPIFWPSGRQTMLGLTFMAALGAAPAMADQASANLTVNGSVVNACTINDATMTFPASSWQSGDVTSTANITYTCTNGYDAKFQIAGTGNWQGNNNWRMVSTNDPDTGMNFSLELNGQPLIADTDFDVPTGTGASQAISITGKISSGVLQITKAATDYTTMIPIKIVYTP